jgi:hypothetical protein
MLRRSLSWLPVLLALAAVVRPSAAEAQRRDRASYRSWIDTSFAFARGGQVEVVQISGDVVVTAWDRDEVRVRAWAEHGRIDRSFSASRLVLRMQPGEEVTTDRRRDRVGESHYELTVPRGVRIKAVSTSGDVRVVGTRGEVEATSTSGDVAVDGVSGPAMLGTMSGDVTVRNVDGDVGIKVVSGGVDVRDVRGDVRASTVSGDLLLRGVAARSVSARSTSGDVVFEGGFAREGRYEFVTHSGDVLLAIGADGGADLSMQTFSGALNTDFPVTLGAGARGSARPRTLEFSLGGGGARVRVETFSGDVVLRRAGR